MYADLLRRYVWLIDLLLRYKSLTFPEIARKWEQSGLYIGVPLQQRTFLNYRRAIFEIFGITIECNRKRGYAYYIDSTEDLTLDSLRTWLISSFSALNQIQSTPALAGRIVYEQIPSGEKWLSLCVQAMREERTLRLSYGAFGKTSGETIEIEPYFLKIVRRRWYLIAKKKHSKKQAQSAYRVYALDRILEVAMTDNTFRFDANFDIDVFYRDYYGIMRSEDKIETVVVKSYFYGPDYLRSLPIHDSQRELPSPEPSYAIFEYRLIPTFDFYLALLGQADQLEVVSPKLVRDEMAKLISRMASYYN